MKGMRADFVWNKILGHCASCFVLQIGPNEEFYPRQKSTDFSFQHQTFALCIQHCNFNIYIRDGVDIFKDELRTYKYVKSICRFQHLTFQRNVKL